jgi:signal transduction histidine kinase/ligand-binding sensor domain-containing protein
MPSSIKWSSLPAWLGIFYACYLGLAGNCRADSPYVVDVWTPYQGLPQSRVLSIAQTPDGYLWVGTKLGWLARFDGVRFTAYGPENTPALGSPEIHKLVVDDRGALWIADIDGRLVKYSDGEFVNKADSKPGYVKRVVKWIGGKADESLFMSATGLLVRVADKVVYENDDSRIPRQNPLIDQFCQDDDGDLWCRARNGRLGRWVDGAFQLESDGSLPSGARVKDLLFSPANGLWIATDKGLWNRHQGVISKVPLEDDENPVSLSHLAENADGGLWMMSAGGVSLVRDRAIVRSVELSGIMEKPLVRPLEMHADSKGGVWILKFGSGVWHVDAAGTLNVLTTRNGLPSDQVETWFEDREKNIWLGTGGGLVKLSPRWFEIVETQSSGPGSGVVSICEDAGGSIWLGRANGLTRWDDGKAVNVSIPPTRGQIPIADVTVAPGDSPGEVWLGTVPSGSMLLRNGGVIHPFPHDKAGIAIRVIRKDREGGIWLGGEFGLFRWDGTAMRQFGSQDGLTSGHIHDISFDVDGNPWIAKAEDLLTVYRGGRFEIIPTPGLSPSLWINSVVTGRDGNVWLGTIGDGLIHLVDGKIFRYTEDDGLPGNSVTQLIEDDFGFLWGGTYQGIFRVSTTALQMLSTGVRPPLLFQTFGPSDGLTTAECSGGLQPACWKARDGQLWFSTSGGAVRIDPKRVTKNPYQPLAIIEKLRVNERSVPLVLGSDDAARNRIGPGRNRYEFEFTGINFTAPEKLRFQWKMDGVDADWVDGQGARSIAYSGLPPGDHRFSVRARNSDGLWSRQAAAVNFQVSPFFWQRPSVRIAFAVVCLAIAYLVVAGVMRRKHQRELKELEFARSLEQQRFRHKQAMENERSRIAAELHDDLGANLTQIQWLGDAATLAHSAATGENELIHRITRKSRDMVRLIDEIVWAVNPKNDTLEQLVTYVCNFAEQFFRDSPTRCRIDVADSIPAYKLEADVRHHLFLIAKEALHNVAKHAATDRVWVRVTCDPENFVLLVEDKGRGFELASAEAGDGLANMRNRAQLAGIDLNIESSPGNGTRITLSMKLNPHIH